jgi:alkylation response protein AidB-like acyl-CoA dehydrogenase
MSTYLDLAPALTPTQTALKEQTHRFAAEVTRPASIELDKLADPEDVIKSDVFWGVFRQYYQLERHLAGFPEELGGANLSGLDAHIVSEEMGWGSSDFAIGLGACGMPFTMAFMASQMTGNQALMEEIVMPYVKDREAKYVGCWAITEPQHGSDTAIANMPEYSNNPAVSLDTRARRDGDDWIVSGGKSAWVSNGTIATHAMVHFAVDPQAGPVSTAIGLVPLNLPGVSKGKPLNKIGQRALNQGEVFFDDVRIPDHFVFVPPELYPLAGDLILATANGGMGAAFTGVARAAFEEAMTYCKQRVQGGKCLCEHQLVQRKLFDMFIKVESARQLSRVVAAYNSVTMPPVSRYGVAAKVYATQVAFEVASDAVQLFGGYGLSKEFLVEKLFRDARAAMIEDGANDVLALAGARALIDSFL